MEADYRRLKADWESGSREREFGRMGGEAAQDAEFLHVAALMAHLFPWVRGDDDMWLARAACIKARSLRLKPEGFSPEIFEGRGDYGRYFAHRRAFPRGIDKRREDCVCFLY
jgi:hypothetical protein